jgi:hypothetical protein
MWYARLKQEARMKSLVLLAGLLFLPQGVADFAQKEKTAKVAATKQVVLISGLGGSYIYFIAENKSEFWLNFQIQSIKVLMRTYLNKDDKPEAITLYFNTGGKTREEKIKKDTKAHQELYKSAETHITTFVKEYKVKEILKKYRKPLPRPATQPATQPAK